MTPPHKAKRGRAAAREAAILNAAREVFVEHGYDDGRVAEIARRAGVAEGTVYLYYSTKKDLVRAVIDAYWARLTLQAEQVVNPSTPVFQQVEALARFHLTAFLEDIAYINLNLAMRAAHRQFPVPLDRIRAYVRVLDGVLDRGRSRGELRADVPVWVMRDVFFGTLEHSARSVSMDGGKRAGDAIDNLVHLFRTGYGAPTDKAAGAQAVSSSGERLDPVLDRLEDLALRLEAQLAGTGGSGG